MKPFVSSNIASNGLVRQRIINKANRSLREYYNMENCFLPASYRTAAKCKHSWVKPAWSMFAPQTLRLSAVVLLLLEHLHISYHYEMHRCTVLFMKVTPHSSITNGIFSNTKVRVRLLWKFPNTILHF